MKSSRYLKRTQGVRARPPRLMRSVPRAVMFHNQRIECYRIPPHTHPKTERVTAIAGVFNVGMGDKFDPTAGRQMLESIGAPPTYRLQRPRSQGQSVRGRCWRAARR